MVEENPTKDLHLMVFTTPYLKDAKLVFWVIMYCLRLQIMSLSNVSESSWQNLNVPKITYLESSYFLYFWDNGQEEVPSCEADNLNEVQQFKEGGGG